MALTSGVIAIESVRKLRKPSLLILMPAPRVHTNEAPNSMLRKPSVTMNGFILNFVINTP